MNTYPIAASSERTRGILVINADDWGRNVETTDSIFDCARRRSVSSVSAMVFMSDSARAADVARQYGVDAGLHLNFTTPFSAESTPARLAEHQQRVTRYLRTNRFAQVVFNPRLAHSFEYVVSAQLEEFQRLYGEAPQRIDGHHHMHLCTNVVLRNLLPGGTLVRRNFSFVAGEKSLTNRLYRRFIDGRLGRRHVLMDFLFTLPPLDQPAHLQRICTLAHRYAVEVETHPVVPEEYRFLTGGALARMIGDLEVAPCFASAERLAS